MAQQEQTQAQGQEEQTVETPKQNNFGVEGVQFNTTVQTEDGPVSHVDIIDEFLGKGLDMNSALQLSGDEMQALPANPKEYYMRKYSSKYNPENPNSLEENQIDYAFKAYQNAMFRKEQAGKSGYNATSHISAQRRNLLNSQFPSMPSYSFGEQRTDASAAREVFTGWKDNQTFKGSNIGTQEELAESQNYMYEQDENGELVRVDSKDGESFNFDKMKELYGDDDNHIITTTMEEDGRPVFVAKPSDSFINENEVYSTSHGAQKTFTDGGFGDWLSNAWDGATRSTAQQVVSMGSWGNDAFNRDEEFFFKQDDQYQEDLYNELIDNLNQTGNAKAASQVQAAWEGGDSREIIEAFKNGFNNIDRNKGKQLESKMQPLDWGKSAKEYDKLINQYEKGKLNTAADIANMEGWKGIIANSGETVGQLAVQVAIGVATQGASGMIGSLAAGSSAAVTGMKITGYAGRIVGRTLGSTQAVGSAYRQWEESGVDKDTMAEMGLALLPAMYATEALCDGWMFKKWNTAAAESVTADVLRPMGEEVVNITKKYGRKASENEVRNIVFKNWRKVYDNKAFRKFVDSEQFAPELVRDVAQETVQENMEDAWQRGVETIINKGASEYSEDGKGKIEIASLSDQITETSIATAFATSLVSTVTGLTPRLYKRAVGMPDKKNNKKEALEWSVLRGNGKKILNEAYKELGKKDGAFGNKDWKLTDAVIEGDIPNIVVPENEILQQYGFEAGAPIDNMADMRFIELAEYVANIDKMNSEMGLNDVDRAYLNALGFAGNIELKNALGAYESLLGKQSDVEKIVEEDGTITTNQLKADFEENKSNLEAIKNLPEGSQERLELEKKIGEYSDKQSSKVYAEYQAAIEEMKYFTEIEEGTKHSKHVNDMVKNAAAIKNQVDEKVKATMNKDGITKKMKKDPDFAKKYAETWEKTLADESTYKEFTMLKDRVTELRQKDIEQRAKLQEQISSGKAFDEVLNKINSVDDKMKSVEKTDNASLNSVLGDINNIMSEIEGSSTTMQFEQIQQLKEKHNGLYENAKSIIASIESNNRKGVTEQYQPQIESEKAAMQANSERASLINEELEAIVNSDLTDLSEDEVLSLAERKNALESERSALFGEAESFQSGFNEETMSEYAWSLHDQAMGEIDENTIKANQELQARQSLSDNALSLNKEAFEQKQQAMLNIVKDEREYLVKLISQIENDLEEANAFLNQVIDGTTEYDDYLDKSGQFDGPNGVANAKALANMVSDMKSLKNAFPVARALKSQVDIDKHSGLEERSFIEVLTNDETNLEDKFNVINALAKKIGVKTKEAEVIANRDRLHTRMLINETNYQSALNLVELEMKNASGAPIVPKELSDKIKSIKNLTDTEIGTKIIDSKGKFSEEQIKTLAEREQIVNDVLSTLQMNRDLIFGNESNKEKVFEVFQRYSETTIGNKGTRQIFIGSDSKSHVFSGNDKMEGSKTKATREDFVIHPLGDSKGKYFYESAMVTPSFCKTRLTEHFNVLMWINSEVSVNQLMDLRKKMNSNGSLSETGEQEAVVNSIISFMTQKKNLAEMMAEYMNSKGMKEKTAFDSSNYLFNAFTVGGDYGVGKTQFVVKRAFDMLEALGNSDSKITIVGATDRLTNLHKETFTSNNASYIKFDTDFISNMENLDVSEGNLYVVDEASLLSREEISKLTDKFRSTGAKILFLGDMFQMRHITEKFYPVILTSTIQSHLLTEQFSVNSPLLRELTETCRPVIYRHGIIEFDNVPVSERMSNGVKQGAKYFSTIDNVVSSFIDSKNPNKAIIFSNKSAYNNFYNSNKNIQSELDKHKERIFFAYREPDGSMDNLIQGLREQEVYIAMDQFKDAENLNLGSETSLVGAAFYTAIGRASSWVGLIGNTEMNVPEDKATAIGVISADDSIGESIKTEFQKLERIRFDNLKPEVGIEDLKAKKPNEKINRIHIGVYPVTVNDTTKNYNVWHNADNGTYYVQFTDSKGVSEFKTDKSRDEALAEIAQKVYDSLSTKKSKLNTTKGKKANKTKKANPIIQVESTTVNDKQFSIGDGVQHIQTKGTIVDITSNGTDGSITYINEDNQVQTLNIANGSVSGLKEIESTVEIDNINEVANTESVSQFLSSPELTSTFWASSATIPNVSEQTSQEEIRNIRLVNDTLSKNANRLLINGNSLVVKASAVMSGLDSNNGVKPFKMNAISLNIKDLKSIEPHLNKAFKGTNLDNGKWKQYIKNGDNFIGSLGNAKIPIEKVVNGESTIVYIDAKSYNEINKVWNDLILKYSTGGNINPTLKNSLEAQKDMNLALWNIKNSNSDIVVNTVKSSKRRISYRKEAVKLTSFLDGLREQFGNVKTAIVPYTEKGFNGRMKLTVSLPGNEEIEMVVTMPKLNEEKGKYHNQLNEQIAKEDNVLEKAYDSATKGSSFDVNEGLKAMNIAFKNSTLGGFIYANSKNLEFNNDPISISIRKHLKIKKEANGNTGWLLSGKSLGEQHNSYSSIIKILADANFNQMGPLYAYLNKNAIQGYSTINGEPVVDALYTNAERVNNTQFYINVDNQPNNNNNNPGPSKPNNPIGNILGGSAFEKINFSNTQMISVQSAIQSINNYLGENFVESQRFLITDGYIQDGNVKAAGMVQNNQYMTLALIGGQIHSSTPAHESFHVIYRNFMNPKTKKEIIASARIVAFKMGEGEISGNEEEWLARNFAKNTRFGSKEGNIIQRFFNFLKGLIMKFDSVYKANNKVLQDVYKQIDNGEYANKKFDDSNITGDVAYEEITEIADNSSEDAKYANTKDLLGVQQAIQELKSKLSTESSYQGLRLKLQNIFIQNSNIGNISDNNNNTFSESIQTTIEQMHQKSIELANVELPIIVDGQKTNMTIAEIADNEYANMIDAPESTISGYNKTQLKNVVDRYIILSDKTNIQNMLQLMLPSYNIESNSFGMQGTIDGYDWERMKWTDTVSSIQKMYLSSIPRIAANGSYVEMNGRTSYLQPQLVMQVLKEIGTHVDVNSEEGMYESMKQMMELAIDKGSLTERNGFPVFMNETTEVIHSMYNYMFGSYGHPDVLNYKLNYDSLDNTYSGRKVQGLFEKTIQRKTEFISKIDPLNIELDKTQRIELEKIKDAENFVIGLISTFGSFQIKNQQKVVFDPLRNSTQIIQYSNNTYSEEHRYIQNFISNSIANGSLSEKVKSFYVEKVIFDNNNGRIGVRLSQNSNSNFIESTSKGFVFVDNNGVQQLKPISVDKLGSYSNLIDKIKLIKHTLGLKSMSDKSINGFLTANSWEEITDAVTRTDIGMSENMLGVIKSNYKQPIDFFSDYIGTIVTLYDQYSRNNYKLPPVDGKVQFGNITELLNAEGSESLQERMNQIKGKNIIERFIVKTSIGSVGDIDLKDIASSEDLLNGAESLANKYYDNSDIFEATLMIASVMKKMEGKSFDAQRRGANGNPIYPVTQKTSINDIFNQYKLKETNSPYIRIESLVESIGVSRSLGFTEIGQNKAESTDFVASSIDTFVNELYKSKKTPIMYVPLTPAADTGKITYAKAHVDIIKVTDDRITINHKAIADEFKSERAKYYERVRVKRKNLLNVFNSIEELGMPSIFKAEDDVKFWNPSKIHTTFKNYNKSISPEQMSVIKKVIDSSSLIKNPKSISLSDFNKGNYGDYDITYIKENGIVIGVVPGNNILGRTKGMELYHMNTNRNSASAKLNYAIAAIEKGDNTKGMEHLIDLFSSRRNKNLFDDFIRLTEIIEDSRYAATKTFKSLDDKIIDEHHTRFNQDQSDSNRIGKNEMVTRNEEGKVTKVNMILFTNFLTTMFVNNRIDGLGFHIDSFAGYNDKVKRNGPAYTPGQSLTTNTKLSNGAWSQGLFKQNPIIFYYDNKGNAGATFQNINGEEVFTSENNDVIEEDGLVRVNPLYHSMLSNSIGGTENTVLGNADMYKGLSMFNRPDGSTSLIKRGDHVLNEYDIQTVYGQKMFMHMLTQSDIAIQRAFGENEVPISLMNLYTELYNKNSTKNFKEIISNMMFSLDRMQYNEDGSVNFEGVDNYEKVMSNVVAFIAPNSTQKGALSQVNEFNPQLDDLGSDLAHDYVDNNMTKIVMNPAQETNTNKSQSLPNQVEAFQGVNPSNEVKALNNRYANAKKELHDELNKELNRNISNETDLSGNSVPVNHKFSSIDWNNIDVNDANGENQAKIDKALEQLIVFLKKRISNNLQLSGEDMSYIDLFNDSNVSTQLPMMRSKILQTYRNMVNKNIQGRTAGIRLTQTSDRGVEIFYKDGLTFSKNDALRYIGYDLSEIALEETLNGSVENTLIENGFTSSSLQDMRIEDGVTVAGQVIMPNIFADKYGHKKDESMFEIMTVKIGGDYVNLLTLDTDKASDILKQVKSSGSSIDILKTIVNSPMVRKAIDNLGIANMKGVDFIDDSVKSLIDNETLFKTVLEEAKALTETFDEIMESFLSRVPANFMGAGSVLKTALFSNGGNVVYTPLGMTLRNDSDFDIDALTNYSESIDSKGYQSDRKADQLRNEMNDLRKKIYMHKDSQKSVFVKSSIDDISKVADEKDKQNGKTNTVLNNSITSIYESFSKNKAGSDAIGIFANSLNAISSILSNLNNVTASNMITSIINKNTSNGEPIIGLDGSVTKIGGWLQAAMDNAKKNIFGSYGIDLSGINITAVLDMNGYSKNEIYDFFNNPYIKSLFSKYSAKLSIREKTSNYDLFIMAKQELETIKKNMGKWGVSNLSGALSNVLGVEVKNENVDIDYSNPVKTRKKVQNYQDQFIEKLDFLLTKSLKDYYEVAKVGSEQNYEYFGPNTDSVEELERWKLENRFTNEQLKDNKKSYEINKGEFFSDLDMMSKDALDEIKVLVKGINSSQDIINRADGIKDLSMIPDLDIAANTLYRLSQIIGMRKGVAVMDGDFMQQKNQLESIFGMTVDEFIGTEFSKDDFKLRVKSQLEYYKANNESYINAEPEIQELMLTKEQQILESMDISYFIKNHPQLNNIIEEFNRQDKLTSEMFIANTPIINNLIDEFLKLQGKRRLRYANEQSEINNAVYGLILDKFYNESNDKFIGSMTSPKREEGTGVWKSTAFNENSTLDLGNIFNRAEFINGFPQFMNDIIQNIGDIDYLKATLDKKEIVSDDKLRSLEDNFFLRNIALGGANNNNLILMLNTKSLSPEVLSKLKDSFMELPSYYRRLFTDYEISKNNMSFKKNGILQAIGTDFFSGNISKTFEAVKDGLRNGDLSVLIANNSKNTTVEDIKNSLFDYLGTLDEFAISGNTDLLNSNISEKPKYIKINQRDNQTGKYYRSTFKLNSDGNYVPNNMIARFTQASSIGQMNSSIARSFVANDSEIQDIKSSGSSKHVSNYTITGIKEGQLYIMANGFKDGKNILVKVNKVTPMSFYYSEVKLDTDVTPEQYLNEKMQHTIHLINNHVSINESGSLSNKLFNPAEVLGEDSKPIKFVVDANSNLLNLTINGVDIFKAGQSFDSIYDVMNAYREAVYSTSEISKQFIEGKNKYRSWNDKQNDIRNAIKTIENPDIVEDLKYLLVKANFELPIVVRNAMIDKINNYTQGDPQLETQVNNLIKDKNTSFDVVYEKMKIGENESYADIIRSAISNVRGFAGETIELDKQVINTVSTFDNAKSLFTGENENSTKVSIDGKKTISLPEKENKTEDAENELKCN